MIEEGSLESHRRKVPRSMQRITRRSVVAALATSDRHDPADLAQTVTNLALNLTSPARQQLALRLQEGSCQ